MKKAVKYTLSGSAVRVFDDVSVGYEQKIMATTEKNAIKESKRFIKETCDFFKLEKADFVLCHHGKTVWKNKK